MACYKRIYYIDYYEGGKKHTNAGFLKLVQWRKNESSEGTCLQIYLSKFLADNDMNGEVRVICGSHSILLGQVTIVSGGGIAQIENLDDILMILEEENGDKIVLRVVLEAQGYFECVLKPAKSIQGDKTVLQVAEVTEEIQMPEEKMPEEKLPEEKLPEQKPYTQHIKRDKWQELWRVLPHMWPFEDEREYLKIELQDLIVLSRLYYRLVENSFLLHGYYNYGHLILTKVHRRGQERICVGVPGNYYEKEKQVAVMFGFESFEPKAEPAEDGDFGYYMIGVDI